MGKSPWAYLAGRFSLSDEGAMLRLQNRDDPQVFAMLMRRWEERIRRFCGRMVGDEHIGEDITQEVFLRLYRRRGQYRHESRFSTYLWRIARNACYDAGRRAKRMDEVSIYPEDENKEGVAASLEDPGPDPAGRAIRNEAQEEVRRAVGSLPERYRVVVVLRHYEDMKYREIAEVLGLRMGTVKSRMAMGLTQLGRLMKSGNLSGENLTRQTTEKGRQERVLQ